MESKLSLPVIFCKVSMRLANLVVLLLIFNFRECTVRLCKTFPGYLTNKGCYTTNEDEMEVPELVRKYGYNVVPYDVVTEDGYTLQMFRIPSANTPILLQHGIYMSSLTWVNSRNRSLAFLLADAGYDIWLGNFRGSRYSRNHTKYTTKDLEFWNFSFHEMGVYDIPAQLKYISSARQQTGNIIYIGYSMGTTASYIYSSRNPQESAKLLKMIVSLAPVAYMKNIISPLRFIALAWNLIDKLYRRTLRGVLIEDHQRFRTIVRKVCFQSPSAIALCHLPLQLPGGFDLKQVDPELAPIQILQNMDSISVKIVGHYAQQINNGRFSYYDYGNEENMKLYGSEHAPDYNLSAISVPVGLFFGQNDLLGTTKNVLRLYNSLPENVKIHEILTPTLEKFSHYDFIGAKDAKYYLYDPLITFLSKFNN